MQVQIKPATKEEARWRNITVRLSQLRRALFSLRAYILPSTLAYRHAVVRALQNMFPVYYFRAAPVVSFPRLCAGSDRHALKRVTKMVGNYTCMARQKAHCVKNRWKGIHLHTAAFKLQQREPKRYPLVCV